MSFVLYNGITYYVYIIFLNADYFEHRYLFFPRGSVGGFYMIHIGMIMQLRWVFLSIRTISLTPPVFSKNHIIDLTIEDPFNGCVNSICTFDVQGKKGKIFLWIFWLVSNYPVSSAVLYVMKNGSGAPWTLCFSSSQISYWLQLSVLYKKSLW